MEVSKHPFQPWHLETAHSRSGWDLGHQARAICCVPSVGQEWERVMGKHSGEKATPVGPTERHVMSRDRQEDLSQPLLLCLQSLAVFLGRDRKSWAIFTF